MKQGGIDDALLCSEKFDGRILVRYLIISSVPKCTVKAMAGSGQAICINRKAFMQSWNSVLGVFSYHASSSGAPVVFEPMDAL